VLAAIPVPEKLRLLYAARPSARPDDSRPIHAACLIVPAVAAGQLPAPSWASTKDFFDMPNMTNHNIDITDNVDNWLRWGNLVMSWVKGATQTPKTVGALKSQMHTAGVDGTVRGPDTRVVTFVVYPVNGAIVIPLPNEPMVEKDNNYLKQLTNNGTQAAPYPLQSFYSACFQGAAPAQFSLQELLNMEARRIGEYVINECM
jgi:hypothetical protein